MPENARRSASSLPRSVEQRRGGLYLRVGAREVQIGRGRFVIGRGASCDIRLDGPLVSRAHAALVFSGDRVTLEDLKSRNGVFVNGVLIRRPVPLDAGDVLRIGDQELELIEREPIRRRSGTREVAAHASGLPAVEEPTAKAKPLEVLGRIVDRAVRAGDTAGAETLVAGHLSVLLGEARLAGSLEPATANSAARYALLLAASTGKGSWIDYVVELHLAARLLTPLSIIHELFDVSSTVRMSDKRLLQRYIDFVRERGERLGAEAPIVLRRLERFQRL